jgi:hypothetical protein
MLSSRRIIAEKIAKFGGVTINCNFSTISNQGDEKSVRMAVRTIP